MGLPKDPQRLEEYKRKLSEANKRRFASPDGIEAHKQAMARPETKARMSKAAKRRHASPEARQKLRNQANEVWSRPGMHEKMGQIQQECKSAPDYRERARQKQKEVATRPGTHERMSEATLTFIRENPERWEENRARNREALNQPEVRRQMSESAKRRVRTPEYEARRIEGTIRALQRKERTNIEIMIANLLDALGIEYEPQKPMGRYIVDFYIPSKNLVIECDGTYWHSLPKAIERDARKDAFLMGEGYEVLRLPEHQIRKNDLTTLYEAIA